MSPTGKPALSIEPEVKPDKNDEEEVFEQFGVDDEDDRRAVRLSAAARVLATRTMQRVKKVEPEPEPKPEPKKPRKLW